MIDPASNLEKVNEVVLEYNTQAEYCSGTELFNHLILVGLVPI